MNPISLYHSNMAHKAEFESDFWNFNAQVEIDFSDSLIYRMIDIRLLMKSCRINLSIWFLIILSMMSQKNRVYTPRHEPKIQQYLIEKAWQIILFYLRMNKFSIDLENPLIKLSNAHFCGLNHQNETRNESFKTIAKSTSIKYLIFIKEFIILMVACLYVSKVVSYPMSSIEDDTHPARAKSRFISANQLKKEIIKELLNSYESIGNDDLKRDLTDYLFSKKSLSNISAKRGMKGFNCLYFDVSLNAEKGFEKT
ncbi:hypothetical protein BpHYR1_014964 [Brachionus plicatilis]|uniref:Uncharacterized protein n=1 Tax=Brachionus plicatilis TaxID=10195 RepID=A0A3M7QUF2_BRAPC|nr:hypothetical protein BpHYR1_014964 [Brachionus plicatilis]